MSAIEELDELLASTQKPVSKDASVIYQLLDQYRVLGEQEASIKASREAVKKLLLMYVEGDELVADGKVLATYRTEYRTYLDTEKFKELFPQDEFEEMYSIVPVQTFRVSNRGK